MNLPVPFAESRPASSGFAIWIMGGTPRPAAAPPPVYGTYNSTDHDAFYLPNESAHIYYIIMPNTKVLLLNFFFF